MEQTVNYGLKKPSPEDFVNIETLNENMDRIDGELKDRLSAVEDADHPGCYYRMVDGVKEWLNPPMQLGVEYRTTERYKGKAVYVKRVYCGALANSGDTLVDTGADATNCEIFQFSVLATHENGSIANLPIVSNSAAITARVWIDTSNQVSIRSYADMSMYTAEAIIKYTNVTD